MQFPEARRIGIDNRGNGVNSQLVWVILNWNWKLIADSSGMSFVTSAGKEFKIYPETKGWRADPPEQTHITHS